MIVGFKAGGGGVVGRISVKADDEIGAIPLCHRHAVAQINIHVGGS